MVAVSSNEEDIIDEALHLLEGYTDPPYPILAAYLGNLSGKHNRKRFTAAGGRIESFRQNGKKSRNQTWKA